MASIAVIIPCYKVKAHILEVLRGIEEKEGLLEEGDETP